MKKKGEITVEDTKVRIVDHEGQDYVSITDMARKSNDRTDIVIQRWLRNRNTIEFLAIWEQIRNPDFNPTHLDGIRQDIGLNSYILSVKKWVELTDAKGIISKSGRYGGTYAHKDIAFEFGTWLSPRFKMYMIEEFQRLKTEEAQRLGNPWNINREISKANYLILTESIKDYAIPNNLSPKKQGIYFATEADLLNNIVFGMTAKQWRIANPKLKGNMRDHGTVLDLLVLANLEALNSRLIKWDCDQAQRHELLSEAEKDFRRILEKSEAVERLAMKSDSIQKGLE